jgi:hypothetical protein
MGRHRPARRFWQPGLKCSNLLIFCSPNSEGAVLTMVGPDQATTRGPAPAIELQCPPVLVEVPRYRKLTLFGSVGLDRPLCRRLPLRVVSPVTPPSPPLPRRPLERHLPRVHQLPRSPFAPLHHQPQQLALLARPLPLKQLGRARRGTRPSCAGRSPRRSSRPACPRRSPRSAAPASSVRPAGAPQPPRAPASSWARDCCGAAFASARSSGVNASRRIALVNSASRTSSRT